MVVTPDMGKYRLNAMSDLGNGNHVLSRPIYEVLSLNGVSDPERITEMLLETLDQHGVIEYLPVRTPTLLTQTGRTLVTVAMRPEASVSELSLVLGCGASSVTQAISALVQSNLVARTKVGRRNRYEIVTEVTQKHADITRFNAVAKTLLPEQPETPPDITP